MEIKQELHYGENVWTNIQTDELRKTDCLCLNCSKTHDCPQAKTFYQICVDCDIALMVTRCKSFSI